MAHKIQSSPAFLLQTMDLGENDCLLTFFTKADGKVRGVARGAKKSRKRFGGALDWFHLVKLQYRPPKSAQNDLYRLDGLDVLHAASRISQNMKCFAMASYFLELVRELTQCDHPEESVFDLLYAGLSRLEMFAGQNQEDGSKFEDLCRFFEINLLDFLGLRPVLSACVQCEKPVPKNVAGNLSFSYAKGGIICSKCVAPLKFSKFQVEKVHTQTLSALHAALDYARKETVTEAMALNPEWPSFPKMANIQAKRILVNFIQHHTHKSLRSLDFLNAQV